MAKVNVAEASGKILDWLVAKCEAVQAGTSYVFTSKGKLFINSPLNPKGPMGAFQPSVRWTQGGPILDKERIGTTPFTITVGPDKGTKEWFANYESFVDVTTNYYSGPTPLIAAMRCYVASKMGEEVEVPDELT